MSTILKTLKKLEEEKSVLDQKLDLKGMVLQEDAIYPKAVKAERRGFFLIKAIVLGLLIAGADGYYYWSPSEKESARVARVTASSQQKPSATKLPKPRTFEGVSMAGILGDENETATKPEQAFGFLK